MSSGLARVSTEPEEVPLRRVKRARSGRRAFFVVLCLFLAAAALNLFGVRTSVESGSGGGYELALRHASAIRPGLATHWSMEIRRDALAVTGEDEDEITVATKSAYFDALDVNAVRPTPTEETTEGEWLLWTFKAPGLGETLTVTLDARIEPGVQFTRLSGSTELRKGEFVVASVDYHTLVFP